MFGKNKNIEPTQRRRPSMRRAQTYYYKQGDAPAASVNSDQIRWWHNIPTYIAAIVIIICLIYSLLLSSKPKIVIINDQATAIKPFLRSNEAYQAAVEGVLARSLFNRTKLTLNTEKIESEVSQQLSEATEVSIALPIIGRHPLVYLRIAEPALVLTNQTSSFVIDEQGRAVLATAELPDPSTSSTLLVVEDESGVAIESGKQALTKDYVTFMSQARLLLAEKDVTVQKMVLPPRVNELHIYPKNAAYYLKYNFLIDVREQTGKYLAVSRGLNKENSKPKQYIDLRVEDRVYVR
jgi:hypothetical protein